MGLVEVPDAPAGASKQAAVQRALELLRAAMPTLQRRREAGTLAAGARLASEDAWGPKPDKGLA